MMRLRQTLRLALVTLSFSACDELLEVDLADKRIDILVPLDGFDASTRSVDFVWYEVEGAREYELLIVEPDLDSVVRIAARVVTTDLSATVTLPDGAYEWQLIAENSISQVASSPRRLFVQADTTLPAGLSTVTLIAPVDDAVTNDDPVRLLWSPSPDSGVLYRVQLATQSFANSSFVLVDTLVETDVLDVTLTEETGYRWRVRAEAGELRGPYAEESFSIDRSGPVTPQPLSPNNGDIVSAPVTLSWQSSPGAVDYQVDVRADSVAGRLVRSETVGFTSTTVTDTLSERYFWRVAARDGIGNLSEVTEWSAYLLEN